MNLNELQKTFALPGHATIAAGRGGLPTILVDNGAASAEITLLGAHILSFTPKGQRDLLWVSPASPFAPGVAIRGGVPLCWPWFGPHASNPELPLHGFARTADWELRAITADGPGQTCVTLALSDSSASRALWNCRFTLQLQVTIGRTLEIALTTRNDDSQPFTISQAIHTYFNISHVDHVTITGYDGVNYVDKVGGGNQPARQTGDINVNREIDAVFQNCPGPSDIVDTGFKRRVTIAKQGSNSAVVWNPWIEKAKKLSGYTPEAYQTMVCVETCNALDDARTIQPGREHCLKAIITTRNLD
jgi:D-hexose-6-phosphate mutarotase